MKYNKFYFNTVAEFLSIQNLAIANDIKTAQEFDKFLNENYHDRKMK